MNIVLYFRLTNSGTDMFCDVDGNMVVNAGKEGIYIWGSRERLDHWRPSCGRLRACMHAVHVSDAMQILIMDVVRSAFEMYVGEAR